MMSKCANPNCPALFRYFRDGKLFRVPAEAVENISAAEQGPATAKKIRRDEFFWLCESCSKEFTITVDPVLGVRTISRATARAMRAAG